MLRNIPTEVNGEVHQPFLIVQGIRPNITTIRMNITWVKALRFRISVD